MYWVTDDIRLLCLLAISSLFSLFYCKHSDLSREECLLLMPSMGLAFLCLTCLWLAFFNVLAWTPLMTVLLIMVITNLAYFIKVPSQHTMAKKLNLKHLVYPILIGVLSYLIRYLPYIDVFAVRGDGAHYCLAARLIMEREGFIQDYSPFISSPIFYLSSNHFLLASLTKLAGGLISRNLLIMVLYQFLCFILVFYVLIRMLCSSSVLALLASMCAGIVSFTPFGVYYPLCTYYGWPLSFSLLCTAVTVLLDYLKKPGIVKLLTFSVVSAALLSVHLLSFICCLILLFIVVALNERPRSLLRDALIVITLFSVLVGPYLDHLARSAAYLASHEEFKVFIEESAREYLKMKYDNFIVMCEYLIPKYNYFLVGPGVAGMLYTMLYDRRNPLRVFAYWSLVLFIVASYPMYFFEFPGWTLFARPHRFGFLLFIPLSAFAAIAYRGGLRISLHKDRRGAIFLTCTLLFLFIVLLTCGKRALLLTALSILAPLFITRVKKVVGSAQLLMLFTIGVCLYSAFQIASTYECYGGIFTEVDLEAIRWVGLDSLNGMILNDAAFKSYDSVIVGWSIDSAQWIPSITMKQVLVPPLPVNLIDPTTLNYSAYFELLTDLRENPGSPQTLRKMRDLGVDLIYIGNGPHVYLNGPLLANLSQYEVIYHNNGVYILKPVYG